MLSRKSHGELNTTVIHYHKISHGEYFSANNANITTEMSWDTHTVCEIMSKKDVFARLLSLSLSISLTLFLWHCLKMIYLLKSYSLNMNLSETIPPPPIGNTRSSNIDQTRG